MVQNELIVEAELPNEDYIKVEKREQCEESFTFFSSLNKDHWHHSLLANEEHRGHLIQLLSLRYTECAKRGERERTGASSPPVSTKSAEGVQSATKTHTGL